MKLTRMEKDNGMSKFINHFSGGDTIEEKMNYASLSKDIFHQLTAAEDEVEVKDIISELGSGIITALTLLIKKGEMDSNSLKGMLAQMKKAFS